MEEIIINNINEKYKWYALYCASNQEKTTKKNIEREIHLNNLDNWVKSIDVPTEKVLINVKGKKVAREKIIIPCYIFMNVDISNGEVLHTIKKTKGVLGFINPSDGKTRKVPEPLKISEVERFLKLTKDNDIKDKSLKYEVGERVKLIEGAFATFEGVIEFVDKQKNILKIVVKIFSRDTFIEVNFNQVEKIAKN